MKRLLLLICTLLCANVLWAQTRFWVGDLQYEVTSTNPPEVEVHDCPSHSSSATIPPLVSYNNITYSVTSIGGGAFSSCSSLTSVTIPNSVTSIGNSAFYYCSSLTSIDIPNSVTSIGNYAFYECSSLTSITIPESVTSIGEEAFGNCSSLTTLNFNAINCSDFNYCGTIGSVSTYYPPFYDLRINTINIGDSVQRIPKYFAYDLYYLISITIPNSVTSIGDCAFKDCSSLTSVTIGNSVTSIGEEAFENCSSLTSVTIGNSVTSIGYEAFYDCSSLTSVTIPNSVTSIGGAAFRYCSSLTSITIGNSVTSIGGEAFSSCSSLTSITIPNSVTSIGNSAFSSCTSLTSATIGNSVTSIGGSAFYDCSSLTSITIPNSVTSIGYGAFYGCSSLTSVTIPNSVTSIGWKTFKDCISLTSVTIPNSVTEIGEEAFRNCSSLTSVTIPNSVTSIGDAAFYGCSSLTSVTCLATIPPSIGNVFPYPNTLTLSVPCVSLDAYSSPTSLWNMFFSDRISGIEFNVEVYVNNDDFGSVAIENNCSTATLTATAIDCSQFVGWNDGNTENPRIVTLSSDTTLTANFGVIVNIITSICQGQVYNENGFNVSEAGTYTQTLQTANGCDSIVTLTLNVNPIYNTELTATICEGSVYNENGFNVSEAGVYTQNLTSVNGCDSIVTLTLNVNHHHNTELTATICPGERFIGNGFNVTAGVYTQSLHTIYGCDSIVTLTVTEYPTFDTTINATINPGETYAEFGFNESEAGTYVQNLQTVNGCDSTITLILDVNSSLMDVEDTEFSFYPNPTNSKITFSQAIEKVEVIDLTGKTILTFTNAKTINIESLPAGAYYLRLTNEEKTSLQKVIKQ